MGSPPLRYVSTRGGPRRYTFKEAVLAGWADDGGMLLPERIPTLTPDTLRAWRALTYPQLVAAFLRLYVDEDGDAMPIDDIVQRSFAQFASPEVVDIKPLLLPSNDGNNNNNDGGGKKVYVAELFHGPSLAFKDLGMQVLAHILEFYLQNDNARPMTFLVGTSGDTGPSALAAVAGKERMRLLVLYPKGRVSPTQEAQMLARTTPASASNVAVVAVDGTSDDLDEPIAALFQDGAYKAAHRLGSLNSVNVVRLLVQVAHYFYCHLQLTNDGSETTTSFAVPTGAGGHVTAGIIAALMGLPVREMLMATNENDILHTMMGTGVLQKKAAVVPTNSPAMDIQAPYNIERILHLLARPDANTPDSTWAVDGAGIAALMEGFYRGEPLVVPPVVMGKLRALGVRSTAITRGAVLATMRAVHALPANNGYLLDPHTAIGVTAAITTTTTTASPPTTTTTTTTAAAATATATATAKATSNPSPIIVCMGCAHPAKFAETVQTALGLQSEAEAGAAIRAWAAYPAATAVLDLVARLKGEEEEEGQEGEGCRRCPLFRWEDRAIWRSMLEQEIRRLEVAAAP